MNMTSDFDALQHRVESLQRQLRDASEELRSMRSRSLLPAQHDSLHQQAVSTTPHASSAACTDPSGLPLSLEEYKRYGRQMILPEIGLQGQLRLKKSSVLIVGAGGLGCPAAAYLAGAGVGTIGVVDGDVVETSNLHRQILHSVADIGRPKVDSVIEYMRSLNPEPTYIPHATHLSPSNAIAIFESFDLVLDCTDNPATRYLISDTCVLLCKPLVSASALRTDGQLMVLNNHPAPRGSEEGGPCYRCIFPSPPPPESVMSCGEGGILGPVVGVMGVLQAFQALRILSVGNETSRGEAEDGTTGTPRTNVHSLLIYSAFSSQPFRTVRLRGRRKDCHACSTSAKVTRESLTSGSLDYELFCGMGASEIILKEDERLSASDYASKIEKEGEQDSLLIDVRERAHFDVHSFPNSVNIPYSDVVDWQDRETAMAGLGSEALKKQIHVVCRLGNDSQLTVRKLKSFGIDEGGSRYIGDIKGGWQAWQKEVDKNWPDY